MLFGQSIFQSVIDRLRAEEPDAEDDSGDPAHRIRGLNAGFAATMFEGESSIPRRPDQAYVDNLEFEFQQPADERPQSSGMGQTAFPAGHVGKRPEPEPVMPDHLMRTAPQDVAAELAISSRDTLQTLSDKRRAFARENHPDSVAPPFRDNATIRMKTANLLIDEAIRRLSRAARPPR